MPAAGSCSFTQPAALRKKQLQRAVSLETPLRRCLSWWHVMFAGVAFSIGAGIFVIVGVVIRSKAGPGGVVSFLLGSAACLISSSCYMEFASLIPQAGSTYSYTYLTLGELPAFAIGWSMILEFAITIPTSAKSLSGTLDILSNRAISNWTISQLGRLPQLEFFADTYDLVALLLVLLLVLVNLLGAVQSMTLTVAVCSVQCCCLLTMFAACFAYGSALNWTAGRLPEGFFPFGAAGVLRGTSLAIFAVSGFEAIANMAEECEQPRRSVPLALGGSLAIVSALHILACLALSYLSPYYELDLLSPFMDALKRAGADWAAWLALAGLVLSAGMTKLAALFSMSRFVFSMAKDGLLCDCFAVVSDKFRVPYRALLTVGTVSACLALLVQLETLANLVAFATVLNFFCMGINSFYLRFLYFSSEDTRDTSDTSDTSCRLRSWAEPLFSSRWPLRRRRYLKLSLAVYIIASLCCGACLNYAAPQAQWWAWLVTAVPAAVCLCLAALLCLYEPVDIADVLRLPLTPAASLLTIFINAVLLASMPPLAWLRFLIWSCLGLLLYAGYGSRHSEVGLKQQSSLNDYVQLDSLSRQQRQTMSEQSSLTQRLATDTKK